MKRTCRNIYQAARKIAGFGQEHAAELLNVSVRSLADYESGRTIPNDDIVCNMIKIYELQGKCTSYDDTLRLSDLYRKREKIIKGDKEDERI